MENSNNEVNREEPRENPANSANSRQKEWEASAADDVSWRNQAGSSSANQGTTNSLTWDEWTKNFCGNTSPVVPFLRSTEWMVENGKTLYRRENPHDPSEIYWLPLDQLPTRAIKKETWVDDEETMEHFLTYLQFIEKHESKPDLFCDQEGGGLGGLGRYGTLSLFQVRSASLDHPWIIDITVLGDKAFHMKSSEGQGVTFGEVLEDPNYLLGYWDARQDADAAFALFGIHLCGVVDLQLMQLVIRELVGRSRCWGLAKAVNKASSAKISSYEKTKFERGKKAGQEIFDEQGYEILDIRPLPNTIVSYAAGDVELLPKLFEEYTEAGLDENSKLWEWFLEEPQNRVETAILPSPAMRGSSLAPEEFQALDKAWVLREKPQGVGGSTTTGE